MIRLHHLNNSRSLRILWLLEELGTPYEIVFYQRDSKTLRAPADLRKIHPLGKAPVLEDDNQVFAETGVIMEYLVSRYGPHLAPAQDAAAFWRYRYWMHYAEGSLMGQLLLRLVEQKLGVLGLPVRKVVREQLTLHLDFLEGEAARSKWLAGDSITAADFMMSYPLEVAASRGGLGPSRPHLWGLLQQIRAQPGYQRALQRGGGLAAI
jgi:glutathione S-transferase